MWTVATGYAPQSVDSSSWEEHGELPRFESLCGFLHSNWLRQFLMTPDTRLSAGVVVASEFDGTLFKVEHGVEKLGKVPEQLQEIVHTLRRFNDTPLAGKCYHRLFLRCARCCSKMIQPKCSPQLTVDGLPPRVAADAQQV